MGVQFTFEESSALYDLLAERRTDIVLKTDRLGMIQHASPAIERLGYQPSATPGPHLLNLIHPSDATTVRMEHEAVVYGLREGAWLEISAVAADGRRHWYDLQMRKLVDADGLIYGALCLMRCATDRREFEERLFAAEMSDPLTGLTNRRAFVAMLNQLVEQRIDASLAILCIDHFKTFNMRYGQSFGDEVVAAFAELVQANVRGQDIVSRISGGSLGVLLPGATPDQAGEVCSRVLQRLAEASRLRTGGCALTASVGVAAIGESFDKTMKRAELALFMAKAKGRNRLELAANRLPANLLAGAATRIRGVFS